MFSHFFTETACMAQIDVDQLKKRFDLAMTKKLAVIKLPPAFWMQDPKINPCADHLLWAALLLDDRERAALALSAMAVEHEERQKKKSVHDTTKLTQALEESLHNFLQLIPDDHQELRSRIRRLVKRITP